MVKKRLISILGSIALVAGLLAGCGKSGSPDGGSVEREEDRLMDEVVVTMPATSEPESGFDPAYGWGAGEHVHEPLIQSTLTKTTEDLKIEKDLATDYQ